MPKYFVFGKKSKELLEEVDPRLKLLANVALLASEIDFSVIEGLRTPERQKILVNDGKSWTYKSKHIQGLAIDVAPYPLDFTSSSKYYKIYQAFKHASEITGIKFRWGGDWNRSGDYHDEIARGSYDGGHFELS